MTLAYGTVLTECLPVDQRFLAPVIRTGCPGMEGEAIGSQAPRGEQDVDVVETLSSAGEAFFSEISGSEK